MEKMRVMKLAAAIALLLFGVAAPARAGTLNFDFGLIGASTTKGAAGTVCGSDCILPGATEQWFTTSGVSLGAIGYKNNNQFGYVTQRPGAYGTNGWETGLGESDTYPSPSDTDYEINSTSWLLIDNTAAIAAGYKSFSFAISSIQAGEGANVYSYSGSLAALDPSKLSLLSALTDPSGNFLSQTVSVGTFNYIVVQGTGASGDVLVSSVVANTAAPAPEPASIFMLSAGLIGLAIAARRRSALRLA